MSQARPPMAADDAALHWVSRLAAQPGNHALDAARLPMGEQHELQHWLATAPANAEAYRQARQVWQLAGPGAARLAHDEHAALQQYLQPRRRATPRRRWRPLLAGVAASLLIASMVALMGRPEHWLDSLRADYRTAAGEVRTVVLAEGSEVMLDGDSAITISLSTAHREVTLLRGAAWFHVIHTGQPFVVRTDQGQVRVLGTRFEVREAADGTQVTVEQGRVAAQAEGGREQPLADAQQVHYGHGVTGPVHPADLAQVLAWREGRLSFRRLPLADALALVQRYYPQRIVLLNAELGQHPVSGDFSAGDPYAILVALQAVMGYSWQTLPGGTVVIH